MNADKMMKLIGDADDEFIQSALDSRTKKKARKSSRLVFRTLAAAAIIMSLTLTVFASDFGGIKSLVDTWWSKSYSSFRDMDKAMKNAGFQMDVTEKFSNGYVFDDVQVEEVKGLDADGNEKLRYKEIAVGFTNPQGYTLRLWASPYLEEISGTETPLTESRQIGDIHAAYRVSCYRFLPAEKEGCLTEEEELWQQQPGNYISYGSDEAEEVTFGAVTWVKDDISYHLMDMGAAETADTLFSMAEELITMP